MNSREMSRKAVVLFLGLICMPGLSFAQDPRDVYAREVQSTRTIAGLPDNPFGEEVDLYSGSTAFRIHDLDIRGNSNLPVRLTRLYKPEINSEHDSAKGVIVDMPPPRGNGIGVWEFEVPRIHMRTTKLDGWSNTRCTKHGPPAYNVHPDSRLFATREIWNGYFLSIPGVGSQAIYSDDWVTVKRFPSPTDGQVYDRLTRDFTRLRCLPSLINGYPGEGFVAVSKSGIKYYFNWGYQAPAGELYRRYDQPYATPENVDDVRLALVHVHLLATRVEDMQGNWVQYEYSANNDLRKIYSNDGRWIQLESVPEGIRVTSSQGALLYQDGNYSTSGQVTYPDGSVAKWEVNPHWFVHQSGPEFFNAGMMISCRMQPQVWGEARTVKLTHPSGLQGVYEFAYLEHHRSGMYKHCYEAADYNYRLDVPNYWQQYSLVKATLTGPGLQPQVTTYDYSANPPDGGGTVEADFRADNGSCINCRTTKAVTVTNPDGTKTKNIYGVMYEIDEGDLLESQAIAESGEVVRITKNTYMSYQAMLSQPYSDFFGRNWIQPLSHRTARFFPIVKQEIVEDGMSFVTETPSYDHLVRPTSRTTYSAVPK